VTGVRGPVGPPIEVLAESNHAALLRYQARFPGALLDDQPTHLRVWTGLPSGFFNAVARARWPPELAVTAVRTVKWALSERRVPWRWYVGSAGATDELVVMLKAVGLLPAPAQTPMALDLSPRVMRHLVAAALPVPGLHVSLVRDRSQLAAWVAARQASHGWGRVTAQAWIAMHLGLGLDEEAPLQHLAARLDGRAAGSVSVFLDDDGTAGIYHVDVTPEARGRGIATWLTAAALGLAADHDASRAVLCASPAAINLYRRLGFVASGSFTYFIDPQLGA
jgi:GNAT superfamily N-acetyltransferase